jgi:hypothetical protein
MVGWQGSILWVFTDVMRSSKRRKRASIFFLKQDTMFLLEVASHIIGCEGMLALNAKQDMEEGVDTHSNTVKKRRGEEIGFFPVKYDI